MANNTIDLKFVADTSPIVQANKQLDSMGRTLEGLIKKQNQGAISDKQFAQAKKELRRSVESLYPSWQRARSEIEKTEKAIKSNNAALKAEKDALRKSTEETKAYALARREAEAENRRYDAKLKQTIATEKEEAATLERLRQKYDQGYVAMDIYSKELNDLGNALKRNIITKSQYTKELERLNTATKMGTVVSQEFSGVAGQMGRRLSRGGVMFQQAGYQVGDFIVQVQSGTNAFVAFGQQATQMAGTLTLLGGKFIGIGTVLGIAIPLVTAAAAGFMRTRKEMDKSADSADKLKSAVDRIADSLKTLKQEQTATRLGQSLDEYLLNVATEEAILKRIKEMEKARTSGAFKQGLMSSLTFGFLSGYNPNLDEAEQLEQEIERMYGYLRDVRERDRKEAEEAKKEKLDGILEVFRAERDSLENQVTLQRLALAVGKDSALVKAEIARQERQAYEEQLKSEGLNENQLAVALKLYDEKVRLEKAVEGVAAAEKAAADEAKELANQARAAAAALRGLENIGHGIARGLAVAKAELVALNNEASTGIATNIAGQRFNLNKALSDAIAGGADRQSAIAKYIEGRQQLVELEGTLLEIEKKRAEQQQSSSGGSAARLEETMKMTQALKDQIQVFDTLGSAMESGFMAMVDGTKSVEDAFREMAKSIISELYKVYVLQKMIGGLGEGSSAGTGLLGGLQGLLGLPGIPAKASGGTVMANQPYLVGEKGPELIMPQNRGHVMNADLTSKAMSGGESITVVQNFSFSANGDESVKRIIAQAAPSIANMAKQSVMDARRRGGAMKNTFG